MSVERHSLFFVQIFVKVQIDIIQNIKDLAKPIVEAKGYFIVDIEIKPSKITDVSLFLDGEDKGINLDDCAEISNELGFLLDAHETFENKYRLNVSSPGLSRPLKDARQYKKNIGRKAKIKYKEEQEFKRTEGILKEVDNEKIIIDRKNKGSFEIKFNDILETKIVPQF